MPNETSPVKTAERVFSGGGDSIPLHGIDEKYTEQEKSFLDASHEITAHANSLQMKTDTRVNTQLEGPTNNSIVNAATQIVESTV